MKPRYLDMLANAFSEVRAWKLTALSLMGLCAMLSVVLVWQSQATPVVLVPAGFAETNARVEVSPRDAEGTSPEYLAQIALGDLALILNWQPGNVEMQYKRFLNRMTSALYARENVKMLTEAEEHRKSGTSQSFYPEGVRVDLQGSRVIVDGFLVRWEGSKESLRQQARFTLTYDNQKGFLHVANIKLD